MAKAGVVIAGGEMLEIERQFLVRRIGADVLERAERVHTIRQGYLTLTSPAIRVREIDERSVMTVKAGGGLVRREVEFEIEPSIAQELFEIAGPKVIEKTRYVIGGWELDVFEGRHEGLLVGEVELDDPDDPTPPLPVGVELWREVTDEQGFTNQFLASLDAETASELIGRLKTDVSDAIEWVRSQSRHRGSAR